MYYTEAMRVKIVIFSLIIVDTQSEHFSNCVTAKSHFQIDEHIQQLEKVSFPRGHVKT